MVFRPAPDAVIGERYRLVRKLAAGGMGSVWLAKHKTLDADVAIKLMAPTLFDTPSALARFEREAKASAQLKSPHIAKVQDYGIEDETPYMVMEYLEGEDLAQRLGRVGRLPIREVAGIVAQICKALGVAHAAGLVHRDLKPSNVFLAREGRDEIVKLLDFGIARETRTRLVKDATDKPRELVEEKTSSGVILGSPHHMSPEQAHGQKVDHRSDLWSLGVVVFRALTGERPFEGDAMTVVMLAVVSKPIPKATELEPALPAAIDRFFARALSRDVDKRFASADDFSAALEAIASDKDPTPWLDKAASKSTGARGPDEVTLDAVAAITPGAIERSPPEQGGETVLEPNGSRELTAVTTGVASKAGSRSPLLRFAPWVLLALLVVGGGGFYLGRDRSVEPLPTAVAPSAAPANTQPTAAVTTLVTPVVSAEPSVVAAAPSASPSATSAAKAPVRPTPPAGAPKARPRAGIDPFTGLPL